mmetsp:Transcript_114077/g.322604  ORF Transcript_114077/g.322604 Transcript_114077/m.322604 type:complete len:225 (-) Transcript_114077:243-917(-)
MNRWPMWSGCALADCRASDPKHASPPMEPAGMRPNRCHTSPRLVFCTRRQATRPRNTSSRTTGVPWPNRLRSRGRCRRNKELPFPAATTRSRRSCGSQCLRWASTSLPVQGAQASSCDRQRRAKPCRFDRRATHPHQVEPPPRSGAKLLSPRSLGRQTAQTPASCRNNRVRHRRFEPHNKPGCPPANPQASDFRTFGRDRKLLASPRSQVAPSLPLHRIVPRPR